MTHKKRIDVLIVDKGLLDSREKAKALIMAGQVYIDEQKIDKVGTTVDIDSNIIIREKLKYVSRGGLKLEKALNSFKFNLHDKVCIDIGSSTGGFTDCMIQNGSIKVFAIDVGYGQLAWKLRQDDRVVCMERTNIRYVKPEDLGILADFASIDVSFISLSKVFPTAVNLLNQNGEIVCLIKPQFEAGREKVGKKGVVRDPEVHKEVIHKVIKYASENNLFLKELDYSPIKGPEGNIEYLALLTKERKQNNIDNGLIDSIVYASHNSLK